MAEKTSEILKSYINYDSLDKLLNRQDIIIDTTKNAINRGNDSRSDYTLEYLDSQILSKENGKYSLMILIKKQYN